MGAAGSATGATTVGTATEALGVAEDAAAAVAITCVVVNPPMNHYIHERPQIQLQWFSRFKSHPRRSDCHDKFVMVLLLLFSAQDEGANKLWKQDHRDRVD